MKYSDPLPTVFSEDSTDLGGAGFHINNASHWVVSHVGSDPFGKSPGIVNTSQDIWGTNMSVLYQTARTSTSVLWYYLMGLANGKYTVQLFFAEIVVDGPGRRLFDIDIQDENIKKDFDITKEAGGPRRPTNITHEVIISNSILVIHLYWSGRGTCCIPYEGAYGPLVSAIKVFPFQGSTISPLPPQAPPHSARQDEKRRGVVAGIAVLCIAAAVISSSVVYLWWKWVSLVKRPMA
uniref:non-specific serine/threonine protein kinase n=1 Tax=Arundo donax TaxID=35708 RepID=A0A0A9CXK9_ARUDO